MRLAADLLRRRAHGDLTAAAHERIARVVDQVQQHLTKLRRVGAHSELGRNIDADSDFARNALRDDAQQFLHDERGLDARAARTAAAGVCEQLIGELGRAQAGGTNVLERPARCLAFRELAQREVRVAEHGDEQVVEVVREPAREHPEALCALRIDHAAFEHAPRGDVDARADRAEDLAGGIAIRADHRRERLAAILGFVLDELARACALVAVDRLTRARGLGDRFVQRAADVALLVVAKQLHHSAAGA